MAPIPCAWMRDGAVPIAGYVCAHQPPAEDSVWPRTNDLGALDLSTRSGGIAHTTPTRICRYAGDL